MDNRGAGGFVLGFLLGALAGAVAALLLAPESGEELRGDIRAKGTEWKGDAERVYGDARTQMQQAQEQGRIVLSDSVKKAQVAVQDAQSRLSKPEQAAPSPEAPAAA